MDPKTVLTAVTVMFPTLAVLIKLDKQLWFGTTLFWSEPHYHEVPDNESMPDGLTNLANYLATNGWPNISSEDRALLLNVTNAARGVTDEAPVPQPL